MSPENQNQLYNRLDRIENKLDNNTQKTEEGFDTMNERVKKIELWKARQEERQSLTKGKDIDWEGIIKLALKALGAAVVLAAGLVTLLQTIIGNG